MIDKTKTINQQILMELQGIKSIWNALYSMNGVSEKTYNYNMNLIKDREDELRKELE